MPIIKPPSPDEYEDLFNPYALELGKLVYAWNRFHEKLGGLFWATLGKDKSDEAFAIWHSTYSDRAQREMLRAAAKEKKWVEAKVIPTIRDDIEWLLNHADRVGDKRNDAVHAPYVLLTSGEGTRTVSDPFSRNRRAKKLSGKDLLREFRLCRESAEVLAQYAQAMHYYLLFNSRFPDWPSRPQLPN